MNEFNTLTLSVLEKSPTSVEILRFLKNRVRMLRSMNVAISIRYIPKKQYNNIKFRKCMANKGILKLPSAKYMGRIFNGVKEIENLIEEIRPIPERMQPQKAPPQHNMAQRNSILNPINAAEWTEASNLLNYVPEESMDDWEDDEKKLKEEVQKRALQMASRRKPDKKDRGSSNSNKKSESLDQVPDRLANKRKRPIPQQKPSINNAQRTMQEKMASASDAEGQNLVDDYISSILKSLPRDDGGE